MADCQALAIAKRLSSDLGRAMPTGKPIIVLMGIEMSKPDLPAERVFESLAAARWEVALRTYGSSHATLIGILVNWWISLDLESHTVLDGAPSHGKGNVGQGDALFYYGQKPIGVLEAEGTNPVAKVTSVVKYFETGRPELQSVWFGVLLLYSYKARGSGPPALSTGRRLGDPGTRKEGNGGRPAET